MTITNKPLFKKCLTTSLACLLALTATNTSAQLRVAAFSEGRGFASLIDGDLATASRSLATKRVRALQYGDINNLCVLQILTEQEDKAVKTCKRALIKLRKNGLSPRMRNSMSAEIYSNLAIAQHLQGDLTAAQSSLARALKLRTKSRNAESNERALQAPQLAAN